jgi:hypothetical protein
MPSPSGTGVDVGWGRPWQWETTWNSWEMCALVDPKYSLKGSLRSLLLFCLFLRPCRHKNVHSMYNTLGGLMGIHVSRELEIPRPQNARWSSLEGPWRASQFDLQLTRRRENKGRNLPVYCQTVPNMRLKSQWWSHWLESQRFCMNNQ